MKGSFFTIEAAMAKYKADCRDRGKQKVDLSRLEISGFFYAKKHDFREIIGLLNFCFQQ
jgi:hypothetical protein